MCPHYFATLIVGANARELKLWFHYKEHMTDATVKKLFPSPQNTVLLQEKNKMCVKCVSLTSNTSNALNST